MVDCWFHIWISLIEDDCLKARKKPKKYVEGWDRRHEYLNPSQRSLTRITKNLLEPLWIRTRLIPISITANKTN